MAIIISNDLSMNWLRVIGTTELSQRDQGGRQPLPAHLSVLPVGNPEPPPLAWVCPGNGAIPPRAHGREAFMAPTLAPTRRGRSMARRRCPVGEQAGLAHPVAMGRGLKA